jgi:hypothetical protein
MLYKPEQMSHPEYFPIGKLGEKKRIIYNAIQSIGSDGGLERKSVLNAMDAYAQEYQLEKAIEAFENTPMQYAPSAHKKAKEIALDAAIRNKPSFYPPFPSLGQSTIAGPPIYDLVKEAEKIYQWLIVDSAKPPTSNQ